MQSNIKVVTENFRAIGHAAIQISGITVVAGENSSGKSTISKLLYYLFNTSSNYEVLVKEELMRNFLDLFFFFNITYHTYINNDGNINRKIIDKIKDLRSEETYKKLSLREIELYLITFIEELYAKLDIQNSRYNSYVNDILENQQEKGIEGLKYFVKEKIKQAENKIQKRPTSLFIDKLLDLFEEKLPETFEVSEDDEIIVSLKKENLSLSFMVNKAIYIDTPMSISALDYDHWDDLNKLLKEQENIKNNQKELLSLIYNNIQGEAEYNIDWPYSHFSFTRSDGKIFDLNEVATGIKAFSIIQLLLKNGHIDNRTLLIIDEPESHLHPQWIVEYAHMIVLLHKYIGVKFFLASHNPDMVSAIRYIAEKEGVLDNVNYYLAEKEEETYQYNYRSLGTEIDLIFASFNIALDRINQYSLPYKDEEIQ
jgi:hypothetical protein|nr:AAA family ATPase [uncultured Capnocytophaga sp.]